MYIEWWQIVVLIISTGLWAEWRHRKGVVQGTLTTITILEQKKYVKFSDAGKLLQHPAHHG